MRHPGDLHVVNQLPGKEPRDYTDYINTFQ